MAKRTFIIMLIVSLLGVIGLLIETQDRLSASASVLDDFRHDRELGATVLITMYGYEPSPEVAAGVVSESTQAVKRVGLGTVVHQAGRYTIVTHDHWHLNGLELELVQIRNRDRQLIANIDGREFRQMIRYQDGGTMIVSAPPAVGDSVEAAAWTGAQGIEVGAIVQVVYRQRGDDEGISATDASVEAIEEIAGIPALRLRTVDGQVIVPGDSGGGIWLDGHLVANLWTSLAVNLKSLQSASGEQGEVRIEENWSRAAVLSNSIQEQATAESWLDSQEAKDPLPLTATQESWMAPEVSEGQIS